VTTSTRVVCLLVGALALTISPVAGAADAGKEAKVLEALRAAPAGIAVHATVKDWDGSVLREGTNGWVCYPSPEGMPNSPMCGDGVWEKFGQAWANKQPFKTDKVGISYMLMGDSGSSNTDPYATGPTADNEWVVEGPHLMIIVPDEKMLADLPDVPDTGGPYVMWKGTPYAHIMVPVR
jgi:hypothetical protein